MANKSAHFRGWADLVTLLKPLGYEFSTGRLISDMTADTASVSLLLVEANFQLIRSKGRPRCG